MNIKVVTIIEFAIFIYISSDNVKAMEIAVPKINGIKYR